MATITYDGDAPGRGGGAPVSSSIGRPMRFYTGQFSFDNSYPTGGEDISDIVNMFKLLMGLRMDSPIGSAGTGKHVIIDYTAKKAMLFTNAATPAEVANASDQSAAINLRFIAWGVA